MLGASRTDAMVSAQEAAFELFVDHEPLKNIADFLIILNKNLPPDIRASGIKEVDAKFNIIQNPKNKEYVYLFAHGKKSHPFCAPLLATFLGPLDVELMTEGAKLFEGKHSFHNYCTKPTQHTEVEREIITSTIKRNELITANFFPDKTWAYHVEGSGFLRNQVRLMMGTLILLGREVITLEELKESLEAESDRRMNYIAPGSGLILNKVEFT